jgi:hypothetical protein
MARCPLDEFPAWACAHLERELASITRWRACSTINEQAAALVRQINDRFAELKALDTVQPAQGPKPPY